MLEKKSEKMRSFIRKIHIEENLLYKCPFQEANITKCNGIEEYRHYLTEEMIRRLTQHDGGLREAHDDRSE